MSGETDRASADRCWEEFMAFAGQHAHADWMFRGVADKDRHLLLPKIGRPSLLDPYNTARERAIFRTWNPHRSRRSARDHQFDIGSEMQLRFQQKLFHLGITSSSIMDDLDGLARTLEWQYRAGIAVGKLSY